MNTNLLKWGIDFDNAEKIVSKLNNYTPEKRNIFKAFKLCDYDNLKAVFIFQDPYSQPFTATGIALGCEKQVQPSLEILKNTCIDLSIPHNLITFDNTLKSWCKQGVLMLNMSLTVEVGKPLSHMIHWARFTTEIIKNLNKNKQNLVYVLFGQYAKELAKYIDAENNLVLCVKHPAYYARTGEDMPNFFKDVDRYLKQHNIPTIKWYEEYYC